MKTWKIIVSILLLCCLTSCQQLPFNNLASKNSARESSIANVAQSNLSEVSPPPIISKLKQDLTHYNPVVEIISPEPGKTLDRASIEVELKVTDLPLFKDEQLELGNHIVLAIDNETLPPVYSLEEPILIENLSPGTHTIRAFAVMPWEESYKTADAYAQTTFNVLTETNSNYPNPDLPLLTYNSPTGIYGAEPILLDFYLDRPKLVSEKNQQVKATINGTSFIIKSWQPYYLTGFKPGENWVQLELIDEFGNGVENTFNNTVRVFNYDPQQQDPRSQLIAARIPFTQARSLVEQNYDFRAIETDPTVKTLGNTESEIKIDGLDRQTNIEQQPVTIPLVDENKDVSELEVIKEETTATEPEPNLSPTLSTTGEQEVESVKLEPKVETDSLQAELKTAVSESTVQKDISTPSVESETVNEVKLEVVPQEIIIEDIDLSQPPLLKIDLSQADTSEPTMQLEKDRLSSANVSSNGVRSPSIAIEKDAIGLSQTQAQPDRAAPETERKFLWWKKLLVGIRQQIESLAQKLPNEV